MNIALRESDLNARSGEFVVDRHVQLVHDVAQTFTADVGDEGAQILRLVTAIRFHPVEDAAGVGAQRVHGSYC